MTVLEACAMLELGDGIKPNIELTLSVLVQKKLTQKSIKNESVK